MVSWHYQGLPSGALPGPSPGGPEGSTPLSGLRPGRPRRCGELHEHTAPQAPGWARALAFGLRAWLGSAGLLSMAHYGF